MALNYNNPGNIRLIAHSDGSFGYAFPGEIRPGAIAPGATYGFRKFDTLTNGFRAMLSLLKNSYIDKGFNTIAKILPRYAPASDSNNPDEYINEVEAATGVNRDTILSTYEDLAPVVLEMSKIETGQSLDSNLINNAIASLYDPNKVVLNPAAIANIPGATIQPAPSKLKIFYRKYKTPIYITGGLLALWGSYELYKHYEKKAI